jgi:hypothetical protein
MTEHGCVFCKKVIKDRPSRFKRAKNVFCNKKCQHEWEKINKVRFIELRDKNWCIEQYNHKSLLKIAKDLGCGETVVFKWFKKHGIQLSRSKWLKGVLKSEIHKQRLSENRIKNGLSNREKNPNWKGGISHLSRIIRTSKEYRTWILDVKKINAPICIMCGTTKRLEVDHIKQFRFIIIDNKITNLQEAKKCQELWDVKNGRILCRTCNINREFSS